jgi:hypothetical protein
LSEAILLPEGKCAGKQERNELPNPFKRIFRYFNFCLYILLQINLSAAKALMWDYTTAPTPTWNTISEADINFNLPTHSSAKFRKKNSKTRRDFAGYDDQRLQLFRQIEGLMEL